MTRRTSAAAYAQIQASGLLPKQRWAVYTTLYHHGPMTAMELRDKHLNTREYLHAWKRLSELRDRKVLAEVGQAVCPITGKMAILWDVTEHLPVEPEKRVSKAQAEIESLRKELATLRQESYEAVMIAQTCALDAQWECELSIYPALVELVALKNLKDSKGKTLDYTVRQEGAWIAARRAIAKWQMLRVPSPIADNGDKS